MSNEQRWYLLDGTEVHLLAQTPSGFIVERVYEGDPDREPLYSHPFLVDAVFDFEHFAKEHPDVTKKREELAALNEKLAKVRDEIRTAEKERPALLAKLAQIPALANLVDVIEDRITHFVHEDYAYTSVHGREMLDYKEDRNYQSYPKRLRLLSLFGSSSGDLQWRIHHYPDASGHSHYQCWPFTSLESATEFARQRLAERVADLKENRNPAYLLESYAKCGIAGEAPTELVAAVAEQKQAQRDSKMKQLRDELAKLEAQ